MGNLVHCLAISSIIDKEVVDFRTVLLCDREVIFTDNNFESVSSGAHRLARALSVNLISLDFSINGLPWGEIDAEVDAPVLERGWRVEDLLPMFTEDGWTVFHDQAKDGTLLDNTDISMDDLGLADKHGNTPFSVAILHGNVSLRILKYYMEQVNKECCHNNFGVGVEKNTLRDLLDSIQGEIPWAFQGLSSGWTVAHEAARQACLPAGFDQWNIATSEGWTVAHVAAAYGNLPDGFDQWKMADEHGWTVLDVAADYGHPPKAESKMGM